MVKMSISSKNFFFDREAVQMLLTKAELRYLSKGGAFVRQRAKTSIRKRRGISRPGEPPSSHNGALRNNIWFALDSSRRVAVIGPLGFKNSNVPEALEHGGTTTVISRDPHTRKFSARQVAIEARPFMGPALAAEAPRLPELWRGAFSKG